ncbi:MBL fold metallo-hydrolase [Clostridium tarantellae]|uniref:Hydrolase n=1 Tax=Clostridium tarantellae TaxID=39493 RepID=A0A6I1MJM3_9CLOT|nr:MBL fold metallo-hydrolase [Clostridium tarantellae]MPQ42347.1 hydrolase [Clostridium tarantellae]
MNIYWFGHSCFLIKTSKSKRILTDPFDLDIGYVPFKGFVDIVTISHSHFDHNCTKYLNKDTHILNEKVFYECEFFNIKSFTSFHDELNGNKRGDNLIFKFVIDDIVLCHLGDLGHILSKKTILDLGHIDILFIPVGNYFTINLNIVKKLIDLISPKYIIPMHYKTKNFKFFLDGIDKFLLKMKSYKKTTSNMLSVDKTSLPNESTIVILNICEN